MSFSSGGILSAAAARNSKRLPTRPQAPGSPLSTPLSNWFLSAFKRRIVGQFAAQQGLLPVAADGRPGRGSSCCGGRRMSMIARSPASACCWAATTCCWMAVKYCGKALKYCGTISPIWRMPALCALCCSACESRSLVMAATRASLRASIDFELGLRTVRASRPPGGRPTSAPPRSRPHRRRRQPSRRRRRRRGGLALANWSILP